jgi:hypothetical protein
LWEANPFADDAANSVDPSSHSANQIESIDEENLTG